MKYLYIIMFLFLGIVSCEDVVEVDLDTATPRLVIDAALELNEDGSTTSTVSLSRTAGFYEENNPIVTNASVVINESNGTTHNFRHIGGGVYESNTINLIDNEVYTLIVEDGSDIYTASQTLERTVPIATVEQLVLDNLDPEITRITVLYDDPVGLGDNYLFTYQDQYNDELDVGDDEFTDGNRAPSIFFMEDLPVGTVITLGIKGIDSDCYRFYETLLQQTESGGPFDIQPATVRGNIVNSVNEENFPFGYFRISEVFFTEYTVQ